MGLGPLTRAQEAELGGMADGSITTVSLAGADALELLMGHVGEVEQRVRRMDKQLTARGRDIHVLTEQLRAITEGDKR